MPIRPGELWLADILFTDRSSSKKRPECENRMVVALVFFGSIASIFGCYLFLRLMFRCEEYLPEWAKKNECRIISSTYHLYFR